MSDAPLIVNGAVVTVDSLAAAKRGFRGETLTLLAAAQPFEHHDLADEGVDDGKVDAREEA